MFPARPLGEALAELRLLGARKAAAGGGFADGFPTAALAALLISRFAALQGRLGGDRRCEPDMKQNADSWDRRSLRPAITCIIIHD